MNTQIATRLSVLALTGTLLVGCASNGTGLNAGIGTGVGAGVGAGIGALAGGGKGALIGAGAGALVGGLAGAFKNKIMGTGKAPPGTQVTQQPDGSVRIVIPNNDSLTFDSGRADIKPGFQTTLSGIASTLRDNPSVIGTVTGYTDNQPIRGAIPARVMNSNGTVISMPIRNNNDLSQARAQNVVSYLISQGVAANRLAAQGMGESNPVADNITAGGRAQNRRVELTFRDARGGSVNNNNRPYNNSY